MKIGCIGLFEAGNLGDDLIAVAVVRAIAEAQPDATVKLLSFGFPLDWPSLVSVEVERAGGGGRDWPLSHRSEKMFADCDAALLGGGGLLQDSTHPWRPYSWLSFLPDPGIAPSFAVGLGVGPLSISWRNRLGRLGSPFVRCSVRDQFSHELLTEIGWASDVSSDFVTRGLVYDLSGSTTGLTDRDADALKCSNVLGVALRAWDGLDATKVAEHIEQVRRLENISKVRFFVLEAKNAGGIDVEFTNEVAKKISSPTEVICYEPASLRSFLSLMSECRTAVSMKLHSSVIWSYFGATVYPIIYAPKCASFFGLDYRGLEIVESPVIAPVQERDGKSAGVVIGEVIEQVTVTGLSRGGRLTKANRRYWQLRQFAFNLRMRLSNLKTICE